MASPSQRLKRETRGQALIETALIVPLLLMLVFNVINFGFFFLVALNLSAAPRSGALYSVLGQSTILGTELPEAGPPDAPNPAFTVSGVTLQDLNGAILNGLNAGVQVCSPTVGTNGATDSTLASTCANWQNFDSPLTTAPPDPEAPSFILNRVDVTYSFSPPLDQRLFNLVLLATPICTGSGGSVTCTFHRQVSMRAMD